MKHQTHKDRIGDKQKEENKMKMTDLRDKIDGLNKRLLKQEKAIRGMKDRIYLELASGDPTDLVNLAERLESLL